MIREKITHKLVFPTDDECIIYMCMYCNSGGLSSVIKGQWDEKRALLLITSQLQFSGRKVKAGFLLGRYSAQVEKKDGSYKPFKTGGVGLRMLICVCKKLNLTYELHPNTKGLTGIKDKQGNWDGLVGDLINNEITVGIGAVLTLGRFNYIDVTAPYEFTHLTFVHGPTDVIYTWKSIWSPLDQSLWVCVGCSVISAFVFLCVINKTHSQLKLDRKSKLEFVDSSWSLQRSVEFLLFTLLFQGRENTKTTVLRCFVAAWYLFTIVITTAYLSKLFGFFVNPIKAKAPLNFDELAASDYSIGLTYYGGSTYAFFRDSSRYTYTEIYSRLLKQTISECHSNATKPKFACISYDMVSKMVDSTHLGRSSLVFTQASAIFFPISLLVEKRSIFLQQFSRITSSAAESGLAESWKVRTFQDIRIRGINTVPNAKGRTTGKMLNKQNTDNEQEPIPLNTRHLTGAFFICIRGCILGLVSFSLENMFALRKEIQKTGIFNLPKTFIRVLNINN
ncbi:unnamed protein product [Allacma fusca]|uniref:Ionotropic glutamate receptor L-glutamate and glycine-binding domain-containing protein n=1 Tax=Allacma fusca TaxID=39272 RepID=A0A8J2M0W4_9HEXA|nr:unnamed protein product [Allacma fusca]